MGRQNDFTTLLDNYWKMTGIQNLQLQKWTKIKENNINTSFRHVGLFQVNLDDGTTALSMFQCAIKLMK